MSKSAISHGLNYLTVQDLIWLNQRVTGKQQTFPYASLEDATFAQYAYGSSNRPLAQAATFFKAFAKAAPFPSGSKETAFLGFLAFLAINGYAFNLPDAEAQSWLERALSGEVDADTAVAKLAEFEEHGRLGIREALDSVVAAYPSIAL